MYIHKTSCISPQQTFGAVDFSVIREPVENKYKISEPAYANIPAPVLRRMGRSIRMGIGTALPLVNEYPQLKGIIVGTAIGGMEDCIKFLNQIIQYEEGTLTPTNFVQSTANAIASQIGLMTHNTGYNTTHVHRGHSFENAVLDAMMFAKEQRADYFLVGGVDEISTYNFNIEQLNGSYKKEIISAEQLYTSDTAGTLAGEGATMFVVSGKKEGAAAQLKSCAMLTSTDEKEITAAAQSFMLSNGIAPHEIDLMITGENGDQRIQHYYSAIENLFQDASIVHYKHLTGDSPTVSAFALWMACHLLQQQEIPVSLLKTASLKNTFSKILLYNNYKGLQHSFMLVEGV